MPLKEEDFNQLERSLINLSKNAVTRRERPNSDASVTFEITCNKGSMENEDITNGRKLDTACVSVTHGQFPAKIRGSTDAEARAVN